MKHIIRILFFWAVLSVFSSCEGLLDKQPQSSLTPEEFFSSKEGLEAFSNNFYTAFPTSGLYAEASDLYASTEMMPEMRGGRTVPSSGDGWTWGAIRNINTLLGNLHLCKDAEAVKYYEALARFFRVYQYFTKVQRYGDVPWYDKELKANDPDLYKPRDTREFVMQKMLEDIDFAIHNLPDKKEIYKITKWTALALKSRFCLFEGTFRKYHGIDKYENDADYYLEEAADAAYIFITESGYEISKKANNPQLNYRNIFTTMNADATEVILARDYNSAYGLVHSSGNCFNSATMGRYGMNKKVVASYLMADGTRFTDKKDWQTMNFIEEMEGRDPRLVQSVISPTYVMIGDTATTAPNLSFSTTGYNPIKYVTTAEQNIYQKSEIDLIIFRAAEVYLNYAEAKAELGTLTQNDLDISVNKLRDRVGMPDMNMAAANASPDPFLKDSEWGGYQNVPAGGNEGVILEIRRERTIELAQEGHRYYDIIRWKEGKIFEKPLYGIYIEEPDDQGCVFYDFNSDGIDDLCIYQTKKPTKKATVYYQAGKDVVLSENTHGYIQMHKGMGKWDEERDYYYPIPSEERSLNKNLTQNPGWDDGLNF